MWICDGNMLGEEVGADGCFILSSELVCVVAIHEGGLSDSFLLFCCCMYIVMYIDMSMSVNTHDMSIQDEIISTAKNGGQ